MTTTGRGIRTRLLTAIILMGAGAPAPVAHGQGAPPGKPGADTPPLLRDMVGAWDVRQQMWFAPDTKVIDLPRAVARRRLIEGSYLEETMTLAEKSERGSFTRVAYLNLNTVSQRYEYFSLDSRAPQQMRYESDKPGKGGSGEVRLKGGTFVAAQWGEAKNVEFKYRLTLGEVQKDQQVVRLYLTPQSEGAKEFLAFEYVYTRQR